MEKEVPVPLACWVLFLRERLEHLKGNATKLQRGGRRQIVIQLRPCPEALFQALCDLIAVESAEFESHRNLLRWQASDARLLDSLFGEGVGR